MVAPRRVCAAFGGALALLLAAGCSAVDTVTGNDASGSPTPASNGVAEKAPAEILDAARKALAGGGSVHVKGNGTADGQVYAIDMRVQGTRGGRGTVTIHHNPVEILRVGKTAYIKGSAAFWLDFTGDKAATELLKGKYLKASTDDPDMRGIVGFTDAGKLAEGLLRASGAVTLADRREVASVDTVGVTFRPNDGGKATVYVATTGKPYPMYLSTTGATPDETSALDFTDYDKPFQVTAPPADLVVDTAKLK